MSRTPRNLEIIAGDEAYALIKKEGFNVEQVRTVVSAAGGPKWFSIYHLTRYIIADLLKNCSQHVHLMGSSVGAWQMLAGAARDPKSAIDRLLNAYSGKIYSDRPGPKEISEACHEIISEMIGEEAEYIINNQNRSVHVITSRGKGWLSSDIQWFKYLGFAFTAVSNAISRKYMNWSVERTIFTSGDQLPFDEGQDSLHTITEELTTENIVRSLQASGAIPFLMAGVKGLGRRYQSFFWDGGLTDYQITFPYNNSSGIVLHPHFSKLVLPGWFDKKMPWIRKARSDNMKKVLLIAPSDQYVRSLPYQRITDLKDFYRFKDNQAARQEYWRNVAEQSSVLMEEFHDLVETNQIPDHIKKYN